jgi:hypothetical protein
LTLATVFHWLDHIGFNYDPWKNGYYADNHEKPEAIAYCRHFIKQYQQFKERMF